MMICAAIGKISELRFPDHERLGIGDAIAEIKPEDSVFGKGGVEDVKRGLTLAQVGEGKILLLFDLVDPDRVTVGKRAAPHILP